MTSVTRLSNGITGFLPTSYVFQITSVSVPQVTMRGLRHLKYIVWKGGGKECRSFTCTKLL